MNAEIKAKKRKVKDQTLHRFNIQLTPEQLEVVIRAWRSHSVVGAVMVAQPKIFTPQYGPYSNLLGISICSPKLAKALGTTLKRNGVKPSPK